MIVDEIIFSFPGTALAEMITVSPGTMEIFRWSDRAILVSADMGSPWLPVVRITTWSAGRLSRSSTSTRRPSSHESAPNESARLTLFSMLLPTIATRLPVISAAVSTCCMRSICDAKVVTNTLPGASRNASLNSSPTTRSLRV